MIDAKQLRDHIVRPVLARLGLPGGIAAEKLVMGTAAQESGLVYLKQVGGGPALGLWQMEPATFRDLYARWLGAEARGRLRVALNEYVMEPPSFGEEGLVAQLAGNLYLGAAACRLLYYSRPGRIIDDVEEMAKLWKRVYNTEAGAGKLEEFVRNYNRIVAPIYREAK